MTVMFFTKIICVSAIIISGAAKAGNIQPVYSLKNLGKQETSDGITLKRTQVKCNTRSAFSYILEKENSGQWCVEGAQASCYENRMDAATQACVSELIVVKLGVQLSDAELIATAEREKLEQELMLTELKRIDVKERQLELRKKELKLMEFKNDS